MQRIHIRKYKKGNKVRKNSYKLLPICLMAIYCSANAQSTGLETIEILGSKANAQKMPGSSYYVDKEQIENELSADINQVLKTVPGVYVREEEGGGLRPNIGIRGATSERTDKVTVMEDGVLIAPAPYSNPSAYYFPTMMRMQSIEIIKGAPLLRYGPQTTGGVINLLSTQIPDSLSGRISTFFGENNQLNSHLYFENGSGPFQFLFERVRQQTDGFKSIDRSNKDAGFNIRLCY